MKIQAYRKVFILKYLVVHYVAFQIAVIRKTESSR
jgi:hypothetical protein